MLSLPRTRIQHSKSHKKTPTHLPTTPTTFVFFAHSKEDSGFLTWEASQVEDKIQPFSTPPSEYLSSLFLNKKNHLKIGEINFYANRTSFSSLSYTKHFPEFSSFWEQSQLTMDTIRQEDPEISSALLHSEIVQETQCCLLTCSF